MKVKTEKTCLECKEILPIKEFYTNGIHTNTSGDKTQRYKARCKVCEGINAKNTYLKRIVISILDSGRKLECKICGYNDMFSALEFHHRDPSEKKFGIAQQKTRSLASVKAEIDKCDILCANCHQVHHSVDKVTVEEMLDKYAG